MPGTERVPAPEVPRERVLAPKFDARDPELLVDPYPVYARLRREGGLCRGGPGQWVLARHADVARLLRDRRLTKRLPKEYYRVAGASPQLEEFLCRMNMGRRDAELAARVGAAFRAPDVAALASRMGAIVDELLERLAEREVIDLATEVALPFPMMVMCELIGIPRQDRAQVWPRAAALLASFSDAAFLSDRDLAAAVDALDWLQGYLGALVAERRDAQAVGGDLLGNLLAKDSDGRTFTTEEIVDSAIRVFYAGFETSKGMLCNGMAALLDHPGELRRLQADRALIPTAIEEFLRYDAPIQVSLRVVLEPLEVAGRTLREGRVVVFLIGSANRDERQFPQPDRLDVGRRPNAHVAFGGGLHYCLGAPLARQEGIVALARLLERFASLELAGSPSRAPLVNLRCLDRLPVAVSPR